MKAAAKIVIGVVTVSAAAMVTGVIPNPFADLHEEAASHRLHEMKVSWNHDGKFHSIPIIEQGVPFDDAKYFEMPAQINENPTETTGVFNFDYEIEQFFDVDGYSGNLRYKVNSNDNSMYIAGTDITESPLFSSIRNHPMLRKYQFEFFIRNSKGDWMLFVHHNDEGKLCIKAPTGLSFSEVITDVHLKSLEILNSAKENTTSTSNESSLEPYRGTFTDDIGLQKSITLWFSKEEAQIPTGVPLMGFGVGIFKNVLEKRQQFLAITEMEEGVMKLISLDKIDTWGINTKNYRIINFDYHLPSGKERVDDIVNWLKSQQEDIARLRTERKNCPPHQAGSECRRGYERQIKVIQEAIANRAKELGTQMMPPIH